ncbi:MAG: leukotriene A4 hydrolase C-terminal domain-containing protein, partial [Bryobacteraceae bacterium]
LHLIESLPGDIGKQKMAELDRAYSFTRTGNYEVLSQWLVLAVRNNYEPAYPRLEEFLLTVGRRKYLKPLYEELVKTPEEKARAKAVYQKARPGYHPITAATIDGILK